MIRIFRQSILVILPLMFMASTVVAQPSPDISNIYVFGDSLSDAGAGVGLMNVACADRFYGRQLCGGQRTSVSLGEPFYQNRSISDGPVAVEVLARLLGKPLRPAYHNPLIRGASLVGENYAISGAEAHGSGFGVMFDLSGQIGAYVHHYKSADPNALYILYMGGNDIRKAILDNDPNRIPAAVSAIQQGINRLSQLGARRFLVYKLLSLGDVPQFSKPGLRETAAQRTAEFNAGIDRLTVPAGALYRFDMPGFWAYFKQLAYTQGIDYKNACVESVSHIVDEVRNSSAMDISITVPYLSDCLAAQRQHRVFFDILHPSSYTHQQIAHATHDYLIEQMTGQCALHDWGSDASIDRGEPNVRRGLPGSIYRYQNPYSGQSEFLRLVNLGSDSAYWYFPTDQRDNTFWQFLGNQPPRNCGTAFRSSMNLWAARLPQSGVATGDFTRAKRGDTFVYANPYRNVVEYFNFRDPEGNGNFWYFPTDGSSTDVWERVTFK